MLKNTKKDRGRTKNDSDILRKQIKNYYLKEVALGQQNWKICSEKWDSILEKSHCDEMKNDFMNMQTYFEAIINSKNNQLKILLEGIDDIHEHTDLLVAVKISALHNLIDLYKTRVNFFRKEHSFQVSELNDKYILEENEITALFNKSKDNLTYLLSYENDHGNNLLKHVREYKVETVFQLDSENVAKMEKLEEELQDTMEWIMNKLQNTILTYLYQNRYKLLSYEELKEKDKNDHKSIFSNFDKMSCLQEKICGLRRFWKALNEDLVKDLKEKKVNLLKIYLQKQKSSDLASKNSKLKLRLLSKEAAKTVEVLQNIVKKGERIIMMKTLCAVYINPDEKTMFSGQHSNISVYEKLQLFWNDFGRVEAILPELKEKIRILLVEKKSIKHSLSELIKIFSKSKLYGRKIN